MFSMIPSVRLLSTTLLALIFPLFSFAGTTSYAVSGMTCGGCVKAVKAQVCKLEGIDKCEVSIGKVLLTPKKGATIDETLVRQSVEKAGEYKVTGSAPISAPAAQP